MKHFVTLQDVSSHDLQNLLTAAMKLKAAKALAGLVKKPTAEKILPDMFDKRVAPAVAKVIR